MIMKDRRVVLRKGFAANTARSETLVFFVIAQEDIAINCTYCSVDHRHNKSVTVYVL